MRAACRTHHPCQRIFVMKRMVTYYIGGIVRQTIVLSWNLSLANGKNSQIHQAADTIGGRMMHHGSMRTQGVAFESIFLAASHGLQPCTNDHVMQIANACVFASSVHLELVQQFSETTLRDHDVKGQTAAILAPATCSRIIALAFM